MKQHGFCSPRKLQQKQCRGCLHLCIGQTTPISFHYKLHCGKVTSVVASVSVAVSVGEVLLSDLNFINFSLNFNHLHNLNYKNNILVIFRMSNIGIDDVGQCNEPL